jgi:hypothetical protein
MNKLNENQKAELEASIRECSIDECKRVHYGKGYCTKHYQRFIRTGSPFIDREQESHGMSNSPIYKKWMGMKKRCQNPNDISYHLYGGRGITVCEEWQSFSNFYRDMGKTFKEGLSLERIDNEKGYFKDNCKWITMFEQASNKRNVKMYSYNGLTMHLADWAKKIGMKKGTLHYRLRNGWSFKDAITKSLLKGKGVLTRTT